MWPQRTWSQNSGPLVTSPAVTLDASFGQTSLECLGSIQLPIIGTFWHRAVFPSKETKVCALPPIFEILPVKSLKARNQTLVPPFPELRYLSLAYNKVTLCFSACFLRGTDGRMGCNLLWPEGQPYNSLHYRYVGSGILRVGEVESVGQGRSPSIQSRMFIYYLPCASSMLDTRDIAVQRKIGLLITHREDWYSTNSVSISMRSVKKKFAVLWSIWWVV